MITFQRGTAASEILGIKPVYSAVCFGRVFLNQYAPRSASSNLFVGPVRPPCCAAPP